MIRVMLRNPFLVTMIVFLLGANSVGFAVDSQLVDNFNDGKVTWTTWASPDSQKPSMRITPDAADGKGALQISFAKSGFTAMVCREGITCPKDCDAVSFWIKRVSGSPGCDLQLEEDTQKCPEGADSFRAPMPVPNNDQWNKVVVPLKEFRYSFSQNGKGDGKLDTSKLRFIGIAAYQKPPFSFKIDCVEFVKLGKNADVSPTASKNVFTTNTSFEIGTGSWSTDGTVDTTTAAVGNQSLRCLGAGKSCPTGAIKPDRPYTLSFYAKAAKPTQVRVTLWMGYSCLIDTQLPVSTSWTRLSVPVPATAHPIEASFGFGAANPEEPIWIDGVQLEEGTSPTEYEDADPVGLCASSGSQSEIVHLDETRPLTLDLSVYNARHPKSALPLSLYYEVSEATLGLISSETIPLDLEPKQNFHTQLNLLPKSKPGYYTVRFALRDRTGVLLKEIVSALAVVRQPNDIAIEKSFFGMHTDGLWAIGAGPLHDIGVKWIRHGGALWAAVEPEKGKFDMPKGLAVFKDGFGALVTMQTVPPPAWATGKDGFPASSELIQSYIKNVLDTYKDEITYYDFHNEPDLTMPAVAGKEASFALLLKTAYPLFQAAGKKLVFDVSGEGTGFAEAVIQHAPNSFDVFAPHPYSNPRYIGPGGMAIGPELGGMREQLDKFLAIHRAQCPDREFWIGELGWALDSHAAIDSLWAVRHAAFLARSHLIARSQPEVDRYICFRDIGCVEGGHYEYGIWRNADGVKPLPAAAAYATVAKLLDGATPLAILSDYDIKIHAYTKDDRVILAVWDSVDDEGLEPLKIEIPADQADVWTMTGALAPRKSGNDNIILMSISPNPTYLITTKDKMDALVTCIRSAIMQRRPVAVNIALPNLNTLCLTLKNRLTTQYEADMDVWVGDENLVTQRPVEIQPGQNNKATIKLPDEIPTEGQTVTIELTPPTGDHVVRIQKTLPAMLVCRKNPISLEEFLRSSLPKDPAQHIVLDKREQILPADPTIGWKGPENLSATASISWNDHYLFFIADVTDDIHAQPYQDINIWRGDAIQFAVDTLNDAQPNRPYDNNDYEYGLALAPGDQTVLWRWTSPAGVATGKFEQGKATIQRVGNHTLYHFAIPWNELAPLKPKPGTVFGWNFIVVDNDGLGRQFWIGMSPGIAEGKLPYYFPKIVLAE